MMMRSDARECEARRGEARQAVMRCDARRCMMMRSDSRECEAKAMQSDARQGDRKGWKVDQTSGSADWRQPLG